MPEAGGFAAMFSQQQIHVLEKKLTAILKSYLSRRASGREIGSLRENPRIPKDAAPDEHAADAGRHPREDILRLYTIPRAEDRNLHRLCHAIDKAPVGLSRVRLRSRAAVNGDRGRACAFHTPC